MNNELERMWMEAIVAEFKEIILAFTWRDGGKPHKPQSG
jgi:hypothetical protein